MDRFDDIWRNRFSEGTHPEEEWNTPDGDLWDSIATDLPIHNDRRRPKLWWWSAGLVLAGLVAFYWWYGGREAQGAIDNSLQNWTVEERLESSPAGDHKPLLATEQLPGAMIPANNDASQTVATPQASTPVDPVRPAAPATTTSTTTSTDIITSKLTIANNSITATTTVESNFSPSSARQLTSGVDTEARTSEGEPKKARAFSTTPELVKAAPAPIPPVDLNPLAALTTHLPVPAYALKSEVLVPPASTPDFIRVTDFVGATFWQHRINEEYRDDLAPFDFNYTDAWGWQAGVQVAWDWNERLSLFTGFQYEKVQVRSGHNSELVYDPNQERVNNSASNEYTMDLATPYGPTEAQFRFNRETAGQASLADPVNLLVDFQSQHRIQNLSVPLGLQVFPLGRSGRWLPSATIGLGVNYLLDLENGIESIETNHDLIRHDGAQGPTALQSDFNNWHLDYRLGLALNYKLLPNLQLALMGDWTSGTQAIFTQDDYETRVDRYHLSLGLVKTFGAKTP